MRKAAALLVAVIAVGCGAGPQEGTPNQGGPPVEPPAEPKPYVAPVSSSALSLAATWAKVVVRSTRSVTSIMYDDSGPVPCTQNSDCSIYPGGACGGGVCTSTQSIYSIFYRANYPVVAGVTSFPIPCDGNPYSVDVFGFASSGLIAAADASHTRDPIAITAGACSGSHTATWDPYALPTFAVPAIYLGLPPPLDKFTVTSSGTASPWDGSIAYTTVPGLAGPSAVSGTSVTFNAPAGGSPILFSADYGLHPTLLQAGDPPLHVHVQASGTPVGTGSVTGP